MSETPSPASDESSILLNAWADELLSPEQWQRLVELLRTDAAFRREYVRMCQLASHLMWASSTSQPALTFSTVDPVEPLRERASVMTRRWRRPRILVSSGGFMLLIALSVTWALLHLNRATSSSLLVAVQGTVSVVRGDQRSMSIRAADVAETSLPLETGDQIHTGPMGAAILMLSDGTRIQLGAETAMTLSAKPDSRLNISRGHVMAEVAPQPTDTPMIFVTPRASVRVLGTELQLMAVEERTEVAVTEGKVRVRRHSDGASAELSAGQFLPVDERGTLNIVDWPAPPSIWSEDFESGLPAGWTGRLVRDGLPPGSRGAVEGAVVPDAPGLRMMASSPVVEQGLFTWHPDSVVHVTFRVQPPSWFHICIFTRTYARAEPLIAWCRVDPDLWQVQPGEWRTVDIPLSEFRWTGSVPPGSKLGRIPLRLAFVGPGDLPGVVIDSLRVDRSSSGTPVVGKTTSRGDRR